MYFFVSNTHTHNTGCPTICDKCYEFTGGVVTCTGMVVQFMGVVFWGGGGGGHGCILCVHVELITNWMEVVNICFILLYITPSKVD